MRVILKIVVFSFIVSVSLGFISWKYLGLDTNDAESLDPRLETESPNEEIGFEDVAAVIRSFVKRQFATRSEEENLRRYQEEITEGKKGTYSQVYGDLPQNSPYATRDVHRKTQGCFKGAIKIETDIFSAWNSATASMRLAREAEEKRGEPKPGAMPELLEGPADLGIFQAGENYDAIVRYSNGHPMNREDRLPDARGFAVKILKKGAFDATQAIGDQRVDQLNSQTLLDILSINFPTFFVNESQTSEKYTEINDYFLNGAVDFGNPVTGKLKEGLAIFHSGINAVEVRLALWSNGSIIQSPLYQEYFSMVPSRLGSKGAARAVKYFWTPEACEGSREAFDLERKSEWPEWANRREYSHPLKPFEKYGTPPYKNKELYPRDYLRRNIEASLQRKDFCYGLYFQPYRDQLSTNIEDSTDLWIRNEGQRAWWKADVVPEKRNPLWTLYKTDRGEYLKRIEQKAIVTPVRAATLTIRKLSEGESVANSKVCEDLSFSPWNGNIEYHKPLGIISRLKRRVYNASRRLRHVLNGFAEFSFERR